MFLVLCLKEANIWTKFLIEKKNLLQKNYLGLWVSLKSMRFCPCGTIFNLFLVKKGYYKNEGLGLTWDPMKVHQLPLFNTTTFVTHFNCKSLNHCDDLKIYLFHYTRKRSRIVTFVDFISNIDFRFYCICHTSPEKRVRKHQRIRMYITRVLHMFE